MNEVIRKWKIVYNALRKSQANNSVFANFNMAFNNAENNHTHSNERAARAYFEAHPNKRKHIINAYNKLMKSKTPTTLKNVVNRAVIHNAIMTYVVNPSKLKDPNYKYRYKLLVKYMKNNPINIPISLYRGVPKLAKYMPNKGNYNSNGRFLSFAKQPNTAKFFAGKGGTVYVLPPGKYQAFNVNANVKKRYPGITFKNLDKYPKLVRNYILAARTEDEIIFAPGIFTVGNVRTNSNNKNRTYKNIYVKT